jgi:two-component system, NtrC family, sensor histidine kinase HydH
MGNALIGRFAISSCLVIAATTGALSWVIASSLERDMLAREWEVSGRYIRQEARQWIAPGDFDAAGTPAAQANFRTFYQEIMRMPETIRVKIYDRDRRVVWSDEPRLIGQRFADNPELAESLAGETVADLKVGTKKAENIFEAAPRFVELYVPLVFDGVPGVAGIAEVYKAPEGVFANIARARRVVVGTALAGGLVLWASLFGIVRAAGRRIDRQHQALEERSRELVAANDELRTVQAQLVSAERMAAVGEVVSAVAHGIRNPLASVRASAQVALLDCRQCSGPQGATTNIATAIAEVDRLAGRVTELLRFVRPVEQSGERVDLNEVVAETLRILKERLGDGRVLVVAPLAPALPTVAADAVLLEEAVTALVENALDAMGGEGTLTLTTAAVIDDAGPRVVLEVGDSGPGIPPAVLPRIFELFFTTKTQGTGLGLPLARKFIEAYGGTLTVTSRPGAGTVFRVTLPAAEAAS